MNRRKFLAAAAALGAMRTQGVAQHAPGENVEQPSVNGVPVPDEGWRMWCDTAAQWQNDAIHLPGEFKLASLPTNPPTGGWKSLYNRTGGENFAQVNLPATVEEIFWGKFGKRPYTPEEYRYAADDPIPQNGAYRGVSWWWKPLEIPREMAGKRILLHVREARMRAEVYLNSKLVGYSIMEELPFECDLTEAARPGSANMLAIRITNPGGRYDWVDGQSIKWGAVSMYRSHGFGGLDRGIVLEAVPAAAHISDLWALNRPEPKTIDAFATIEGKSDEGVVFDVVHPRTGEVLATERGVREGTRWHARIACPAAALWDLKTPSLYTLRARHAAGHVRTVTFGFRWFAPSGLGTNAVFRLNGRRIKLYSSISWGFWGLNGIWPTPELAEREVTQAQKLGLNCLNFHRNVGKRDVMAAHDRLGLLRYMEPGGGKLSVGKLPSGVAANSANIVMAKPTSDADRFSQRFMLEKCRAMVRTFRSHPSLIQYTLQNEIGADLSNPETFVGIQAMHDEDPSRSVVLNDGFSPPPRSAPQAWFEPYNNTMHRSDREEWAGWFNNHQGAGDQWYDEFYKDADNFTYRKLIKTSLVEFGEMEGCAVADNHPQMIRQIEEKQLGSKGSSYDLQDHKQIADGLDRFLDRWQFRTAFPSAEKFYQQLGNKCYESWQQYMENARICDEIDFAVISGWESTAMENHSGIVDNLRNFKGDPAVIASSLRPVCAVAKQHKLCYAVGDRAVFDLYLLNDTAQDVGGELRFSMIAPDGGVTQIGAWPSPARVPDQFSYLVARDVSTKPLTQEGIYRFRISSASSPAINSTREIWVAQTTHSFTRPLRIGMSGLLSSVRSQLEKLNGLHVTAFDSSQKYDLIVASGVVKGSKLDRQVGEETGLEEPPKGTQVEKQVPGMIPADVLDAVKRGTPLLAIVPEDSLADGVARQLASLGAFQYRGQVGDTRAPWMGNWLFVREHATFAHLPANRVMGVHYQAHGKQSNGLLIERAEGGAEPEIIIAYSRDHDRQTGAASVLCRVGGSPVLLHRAPAFSAPLQMRWLANTIGLLTGGTLA